jgi:hypothetical protein
MNIVSKKTIAAVLLSGTAFIGGAMAQEQSADGVGTSQDGANVIVPQAGASGQVDTSAGADTSSTKSDADADTAASKKIVKGSPAEGSAQTEAGGTGAETAGSTGAATEEDKAKSSQLDANGQSPTTTTTEKDAETAADTPDTEQSDEASTSKPSNETTASIDITSIRNVIVESKAEPVDLDIEVNVGVVVPRTVELRPLPPRIIEIVPAYRSYEYFVLADGRIIIVEPGTLKVVYVITA